MTQKKIQTFSHFEVKIKICMGFIITVIHNLLIFHRKHKTKKKIYIILLYNLCLMTIIQKSLNLRGSNFNN
jgi:Mn2+/Fe2+ NRAMP family transporter